MIEKNRIALPETERRRMLSIMGFESWVRRSNAVVECNPGEEIIPIDSAPRQRFPLSALPLSKTSLTSPQNSLSSKTQLQNQSGVFLVLENRLHADSPLIRSLTLLLPGCTICTPETIASGVAKFALQMGMDIVLPPDVLGLRAPTIAELRNSASARRALWWAIKPVLRQLKL